MNDLNNHNQDIFHEEDLLSENALNSLSEIGKWGRFIAIVNFVLLSIFLIAILFFFSFLSGKLAQSEINNNFPIAIMPVAYTFMILIYGLINYFFYKYSNNIRTGARERSSLHLENAFRIQKTFFKITAIITIIGLTFYGIIILIALIAGVSTM